MTEAADDELWFELQTGTESPFWDRQGLVVPIEILIGEGMDPVIAREIGEWAERRMWNAWEARESEIQGYLHPARKALGPSRRVRGLSH